jgi:hypothetical protein
MATRRKVTVPILLASTFAPERRGKSRLDASFVVIPLLSLLLCLRIAADHAHDMRVPHKVEFSSKGSDTDGHVVSLDHHPRIRGACMRRAQSACSIEKRGGVKPRIDGVSASLLPGRWRGREHTQQRGAARQRPVLQAGRGGGGSATDSSPRQRRRALVLPPKVNRSMGRTSPAQAHHAARL